MKYSFVHIAMTMADTKLIHNEIDDNRKCHQSQLELRRQREKDKQARIKWEIIMGKIMNREIINNFPAYSDWQQTLSCYLCFQKINDMPEICLSVRFLTYFCLCKALYCRFSIRCFCETLYSIVICLLSSFSTSCSRFQFYNVWKSILISCIHDLMIYFSCDVHWPEQSVGMKNTSENES
jgi:hypothetical protein